MVDRTTLTVIGSFVMVLGLGLALVSGRLAHSHAEYLRSGRRRPRPLKFPPFDVPENEGVVRWWGRLVGLFIMLVGALWIAGVGSK